MLEQNQRCIVGAIALNDPPASTGPKRPGGQLVRPLDRLICGAFSFQFVSSQDVTP